MLFNKPIYRVPRYELAWPAGWSLAIGSLGAWVVLSGRLHFGFSAFFVIYLVLGLGMWQEQRWAARGGLFLYGLGAGLRLLGLIFAFQWKHVAYLIALGSVAWQCWEALQQMPDGKDEADDEESPMLSLVLLQRSQKFLEDTVLAKVVEAAWGGSYSTDDEDGDGFVVGETPLFILKSDQGMYLLHNRDCPYWEDVPSVVQEVGELRLKKAIEDHSAWLSIDAVDTDKDIDEDECYRKLAELAVELADEDTLAIYQPQSGVTRAWSNELANSLISSAVSEALAVTVEVPVIPVADDDPAMARAISEAKRRWPEFQSAFKEKSEACSKFSVKAKVTLGENTEHIWLEVIGLEPNFIHGKLANAPVALGDLQIGSQVEVHIDDMSDWCFMRGETLVGLFSRNVLENAVKTFGDNKQSRNPRG